MVFLQFVFLLKSALALLLVTGDPSVMHSACICVFITYLQRLSSLKTQASAILDLGNYRNDG